MSDESSPITREEMIELFGEYMPIEAVTLVWDSPGEMTIGEVRAKLRQMAREKRGQSFREIKDEINGAPV